MKIINDKAGAGGAVGAEAVAKCEPDGHTLLLANTGTMVINPAVYSKLPYNTLKDFVPLARTAQQPLAIAQGADPAFLASDEFTRFLCAEMPRWAGVVKRSGAKLG